MNSKNAHGMYRGRELRNHDCLIKTLHRGEPGSQGAEPDTNRRGCAARTRFGQGMTDGREHERDSPAERMREASHWQTLGEESTSEESDEQYQ
ncbi:hypothetical protein [Kitasatospora sp. NPDC054795]